MTDSDSADRAIGCRLYPRRSAVCLAVASGAALCTLWLFRCPEWAMFLQLKVVAVLLGGVVYLALIAAWFEASRQLWIEGSSLRRPCVDFFLLTGVYAGMWYALACSMPMRTAFALSESSFRWHAKAALADPGYQGRFTPRIVGLFFVQSIEVIEDTVVFYTLNDRSPYGFALVPGVRADRVCNGFPIIGGLTIDAFPKGDDLTCGDRIHGDWFVVFSGYWSQKLGWS